MGILRVPGFWTFNKWEDGNWKAKEINRYLVPATIFVRSWWAGFSFIWTTTLYIFNSYSSNLPGFSYLVELYTIFWKGLKDEVFQMPLKLIGKGTYPILLETSFWSHLIALCNILRYLHLSKFRSVQIILYWKSQILAHQDNFSFFIATGNDYNSSI